MLHTAVSSTDSLKIIAIPAPVAAPSPSELAPVRVSRATAPTTKQPQTTARHSASLREPRLPLLLGPVGSGGAGEAARPVTDDPWQEVRAAAAAAAIADVDAAFPAMASAAAQMDAVEAAVRQRRAWQAARARELTAALAEAQRLASLFDAVVAQLDAAAGGCCRTWVHQRVAAAAAADAQAGTAGAGCRSGQGPRQPSAWFEGEVGDGEAGDCGSPSRSGACGASGCPAPAGCAPARGTVTSMQLVEFARPHPDAASAAGRRAAAQACPAPGPDVAEVAVTEAPASPGPGERGRAFGGWYDWLMDAGPSPGWTR